MNLMLSQAVVLVGKISDLSDGRHTLSPVRTVWGLCRVPSRHGTGIR